MERTERFYKMIRMLRASPVVSAADFQNSLEVSRATFKRDLEYLRDRFQVPIDFDRDLGGYRIVFAQGGPTELPGLWFSETETHALVSMHELLRSLEPGLLSPFIAPMMERLTQLLAGEDHTVQEVQRRIRILQHAARRHKLEHFEVVATAVLERRRLVIRHYNRQDDTETEREVSPQRLVYYRDNWFLDAWCHLRADIRTFAVDALRAATLQDKRAKSVPDRELDMNCSWTATASSVAAPARPPCFDSQRRGHAGYRWRHGTRARKAALNPTGRGSLKSPTPTIASCSWTS
jgi:predicted DNA-binding transcriptional regulator YafY